MNAVGADLCPAVSRTGLLCTLPPAHGGRHEAWGDPDERSPIEAWPQPFPHRCPGEGCAVCRWQAVKEL